MRVILVAPNSRAHTITPPLGLGYLAASLLAHGHEVAILDLARERVGPEKGAEMLANQRPELIGVGIMSTGYLPARALLAAVKKRLPGVPVVIGGPHVTAMPEDAMNDLDVDMAVAGEAEAVLPQLVNALQSGDPLDAVPSLYHCKNGVISSNERAEFTRDLDAIAFPAWDLIDPRTYPDLPHQLLHKRFPVAPIMTSRGCPFDCTFCSSTTLWGRGWRTRSAGNVVDEIEMLVRDYGVREIHFEDDNFTLKASHAAAICEEIVRRRLDIVWSCPNGVRIDSLDDDLLALMKRSGCYSLGFGIESGSQAVLDKNNKKLKLERVAGQVEMVKRHGISTLGFFIIGLPGETEETIRETIAFARRVPFDRANFGLLSPLPGSQIFRDQVLKGDDGDGYDHRVLNYFTPFPMGELSAEELNRWQRRAVYRFYLRPRQLLRLARDIRPAQVKQLLRALKDYSS